jgi:hypothetical protein
VLVCILCYHREEERLSTHRGSSQLIELRQRGVASSLGWVDLDLCHHPTVFMVKNQEYGSDIRISARERQIDPHVLEKLPGHVWDERL